MAAVGRLAWFPTRKESTKGPRPLTIRMHFRLILTIPYAFLDVLWSIDYCRDCRGRPMARNLMRTSDQPSQNLELVELEDTTILRSSRNRSAIVVYLLTAA